MEIFLTIIAGVSVFVLGQIILYFFLNPIQQQKEVLGEITHALIFHADVYSNPGIHNKEITMSASVGLREVSCQLLAKTNIIPIYSLLSFIKVVNKRKNINEAHGLLMGLSNSVYSGKAVENNNKRKRIQSLLKI